jgi:lysophospholipase L1-like esterase
MPIAVLQGLWVMQRTPKLPSPVGQSGRYGCGKGTRTVRVVGIGDSVMAGTGVVNQQHSMTATYARLLHERTGFDVTWRVHGQNGATSAKVLHRIAPAAAPADIYLLSVGVNDATRGVQPEAYARNLHRILLLLRRKSPRSTILFGGLPPLDCFPALPWPLNSMLAARARELQELAQDVVRRHERTACFHFPSSMPADQFAGDGFHPAEFACERWASGLLDLWQPTLEPSSSTATERLEQMPALSTTRLVQSRHRRAGAGASGKETALFTRRTSRRDATGRAPAAPRVSRS